MLEGTRLGDSIAVNGCCLTVTDLSDGTWTADVMAETLDKTSLAGSRPGDRVNLERAVTPQTRLGGHIVQGHVDGVGEVLRRTPSEHWEVVEVSLPPHLAPYLVDKGSITVDGVSLTVVEAGEQSFTVSLIPETLARTTLGHRRGRRPRQPRGRHHRQARREAAAAAAPRAQTAHDRKQDRWTSSSGWSTAPSPSPAATLSAPEVVGNLFGLASAVLGMKRLVWAWPIGLVGNVLLFTVFASGELSGVVAEPLWGQAGRQVFFAAVALYGWVRWSRSRRAGGAADGGAITPRWATWTERGQLLALGVVGYAVAYVVLQQIGSWGPATEAWILAGLDARDVRHGPRLGGVLDRVDARRRRRRDHARRRPATTRRPACTSSTPPSWWSGSWCGCGPARARTAPPDPQPETRR